MILAAGRSSRMGLPKQNLHLGGQTILQRVVGTFRKSNVDEIIVVVASSSQARSLQAGTRVVLNRHRSLGISSSIRAGLRAVNDDSEGVLFGLGDKPFVKPRTINQLIKAFRRQGAGIVVPVYKGHRGNPVIFAKEFFRELGRLSGEEGGKSVIKRNEKRVFEVKVNDEGVLLDIDTSEDYESALARLSQSRNRSPR